MGKQLKGLGGWLAFAMAGMLLSFAFNFVSIFWLFEDYEINLGFYFILGFTIIDTLLILLTFFLVLAELKIGKYFAITIYSLAMLANIITEQYDYAVISLVWLLYFVNSKRVKNTLVK